MTDTINSIAQAAGVDESSARWLAEYIARQTPPEHAEELLADPDWIKACTADWLRMTRHMAHQAMTRKGEAAQAVLAEVRRQEAQA